MNKLPPLTLAFWIMKISATTLGETGGDWLSMTMGLGYLISTLIFSAFFAATLAGQLFVKKHHAFLYWSVIVATSTFGTTLSDYMDRTLHLGYERGAAILVTLLLLVLGAWKYFAGTVDVATIRTRRAEIFYWFTILISNTLGTAVGDFLSDDSGLGFLGSWLLITSVLAALIALYYFTRINRVILFWVAFILTRPFGATFGDVLTKSAEKGGLDFGTGRASLILLSILLISIAFAYRKPRYSS